jgi:hypothetical protein
MDTRQIIGILAMGFFAAAAFGCAPGGAEEGSDNADRSSAALEHEAPTAAALPSGDLQAQVVEISGDADLLSAVNDNGTAYIHTLDNDVWYWKSGNYLLGIESFVQYHKKADAWVDFDTGSKVAPRMARVVGHNYRGSGWFIPSLDNGGEWPVSADSVWVVGTDGGILGMGGAPQGIPIGTEVFGSMQTYGGITSTPYLIADDSPKHDSARIQGMFSFGPDTLLGGHSAGSSAARRLAIDLGLTSVWLYGTPNYSRKDGAYEQHEKNGMAGEVINNDDDPVTNCLWFPIHLVSLAWGTSKCHNYSNWDYQQTAPVETVCN